MTLEQDLRRALKRKDPPSGFDDRILLKIAAGETARALTATRRWRQGLVPAAAALVLTLGTAYYIQFEQRRPHGARANTANSVQDVVLALQIASETISAAQTKVEEITRYEPAKDY